MFQSFIIKINYFGKRLLHFKAFLKNNELLQLVGKREFLKLKHLMENLDFCRKSLLLLLERNKDFSEYKYVETIYLKRVVEESEPTTCGVPNRGGAAHI